MIEALKSHWPEYLIEAGGLGLFMISAALFATVLEHPDSPIRQSIADPFLRRIPMGLAMGLTAIAIIYSPFGKQSGAHINPAVTLTFYRLGKIEKWDAVFYITAQIVGGITGILIASLILGIALSDPNVNYVVTVPGSSGEIGAFFCEFFLAFVLMMMILVITNRKKIASLTGLLAGTLVAIYIIFEAPISGMSINPARSLSSAIPSNTWTSFWIYIIAPIFGMFVAAEVYTRVFGSKNVKCAKLHHQNDKRCIFRCGYKKENELAT